MNRARLVGFLGTAVAAGLLSACAPKQVKTPEPVPDPKTATLVVLLPDEEGGGTGPSTELRAGRATVSSNKGSSKPGSVDLAKARESTIVGNNQPPTRVTVMSDAEIKREFGDVLSALPPAPQHFTLYFRFESDELTADSSALVPEILRAVKQRPVPEVVVTGHTDTTGTAARNFELGLKRATMVRGLLVNAGLDPSSIEVTSHGEAALLVATPDDTYEPRNRRVEITIK
jgi:outer membrane protein OmpA-like peptidoglycan-associated protein